MSMIMCRARERLRHMAFRISRVEYAVGAVQDAVDALVVQLGKAKAEVLSKIDELEAQIEAGETPDLSALKDAVQALDDVVPDVVVEEPPVEDAPVE